MKKLLVFLFVMFLSVSFLGSAGATVITYENWNGQFYSTPEGWGVLQSVDPKAVWPYDNLNHWRAYTLAIPDSDWYYRNDYREMKIIFHGINNWQYEPDDTLHVFFFDNSDPGNIIDNITTPIGWTVYGDVPEYPWSPNWQTAHSANLVDVWSDPYDNPANKFDVEYTVSKALLDSVLDSGASSFVIAIDPDCHYFLDNITVEVPIPEPGSILLLGTGLLGLAGVGRKMFIKKIR